MLVRTDCAGTALVVISTESSITLAVVTGQDERHEVCLPAGSDEVARVIDVLRRPQSPYEGLVASMGDERGRITVFRDLPDGVSLMVRTDAERAVWLHRDHVVVADVAAYLEQVTTAPRGAATQEGARTDSLDMGDVNARPD